MKIFLLNKNNGVCLCDLDEGQSLQSLQRSLFLPLLGCVDAAPATLAAAGTGEAAVAHCGREPMGLVNEKQTAPVGRGARQAALFFFLAC